MLSDDMGMGVDFTPTVADGSKLLCPCPNMRERVHKLHAIKCHYSVKKSVSRICVI